MANEINTNLSAVLLNNAHKPAGKTEANGGSNKTAETPNPFNNQEDRVSVTAEATRLQQIEEKLSAVPEVNSAKVAEIKAAIANGTFSIDPQTIANKLIAFETGK